MLSRRQSNFKVISTIATSNAVGSKLWKILWYKITKSYHIFKKGHVIWIALNMWWGAVLMKYFLFTFSRFPNSTWLLLMFQEVNLFWCVWQPINMDKLPIKPAGCATVLTQSWMTSGGQWGKRVKFHRYMAEIKIFPYINIKPTGLVLYKWFNILQQSNVPGTSQFYHRANQQSSRYWQGYIA